MFVRPLHYRMRPGEFLTLVGHHKPTRRTRCKHFPVGDFMSIKRGLKDLLTSNAAGWEAWMCIGSRSSDIGSKRGGKVDIASLPALFVDIDIKYNNVYIRHLLKGLPNPSAIIKSGRGAHIYWWLAEGDRQQYALIGRTLRGLALWCSSDVSMTIEQSMRIPGSLNHRRDARAEIIYLSEDEYTLSEFGHIFPEPIDTRNNKMRRHKDLNPDLIRAITGELILNYDGKRTGGEWIAARCPLGHHRADHTGSHFHFNVEKGFGKCKGKHGTANLIRLCQALKLDINPYGGIYSG